MVNRYSRPNDNPDLLAERQSCPFDTDDLAAKIHGGIQVLRERHRILKAVEDEPELRDTIQDLSHMTRMEKFENSYKKTVIAEKYMDRIIDRNVTQQYEHFQ
jgi:hypothetical protein